MSYLVFTWQDFFKRLSPEETSCKRKLRENQIN